MAFWCDGRLIRLYYEGGPSSMLNGSRSLLYTHERWGNMRLWEERGKADFFVRKRGTVAYASFWLLMADGINDYLGEDTGYSALRWHPHDNQEPLWRILYGGFGRFKRWGHHLVELAP